MKRVRTGDETLEKIQSNVEDALRPVEGCPLVRGVLIENVSVFTTARDVEHGLGRKLRGFTVVRSNCDTRVYEPEVHPLIDRLVKLQATANAVVTLYVF